MPDVSAELTFTVDTGVAPVAASLSPEGRVDNRGTFARHSVVIRDARTLEGGLSLDREGFLRVDHGSSFEAWADPQARASTNDPEVQQLIGEVTGAKRVVIFDHTLRSSDETEQRDVGRREPVQLVHNDYTERSGPSRLALALPDDAETLRRRRFAIVQLWRSIEGPVRRDPLAFCDARSVRPEDLIRTERRHAHRVGEIYNVAHHPEQRWFYFPELDEQEAVLFKVFDSDAERARFTPHTSFSLPGDPAAQPPRRSLEVRALALF